MDPSEFDPSRLSQLPKVTGSRLMNYNFGSNTKSLKDKQKEMEDAKRKEEQIETEKAYKEYVEDFELGSSKTTSSSTGFIRSRYRHQPHLTNNNDYNTIKHRSSAVDNDRDSRAIEINSQGKLKGKSQIDSFLQEIKREQADRDNKKYQSGSNNQYDNTRNLKDNDSLTTTNIYVAGVPNDITEQSFGEFFARFGPVASIKIMWPRDDESRHKYVGLSGFVSYMNRRDTEVAVKELDGSFWDGNKLKIDWGKPVRIPSRPMFESRSSLRRRSRSPSPSLSNNDSKRHKPSFNENKENNNNELDDYYISFIDELVANIKCSGRDFDSYLNDLKSSSDSLYYFLNDERDPKYIYLMNLLENERPFDDDGEILESDVSSDNDYSDDEHIKKEEKLNLKSKRKLQSMLRLINPKRASIAEIMVYSLDHSNSVQDVVDIITKSLLIISTPVPRKIARLHLVSDILSNSAVGVPGAWKYRELFGRMLPKIFDHLGFVRSTFPSKLQANSYKERIEVVLQFWNESFIFPQIIVDDLQRRLDGTKTEVEHIRNVDVDVTEHTPSIISNGHVNNDDNGFKQPTFNTVNNEEYEDLDGQPLQEDLDGEPMEDIDGQPLADEDIDGQPLDEDIDGEPLQNEDIDGAPMTE